MIYLLILIMLGCGYYTFTFGLSQWRKQNRLGGISTMAAAVVGTVLPAVMLILKA
ncbi:MAG TPA: DUF3953 domain-containing protein [Bacillota bacterium]|nr:DUF3953 domain-containing protein [Bacillota bacterium]